MPTEEQVLKVLRDVMDPDLGRDIVSLGFVKDLEIDAGTVRFNLELTTPACPMRAQFKQACEQRVGALEGVERVEVALTARPKTPPAGRNSALENVGAIVAVSSCKGGVGKSTIAMHLARQLHREGHKVGILDADIFGPSFPTLLNIHAPEVLVHDNRIVPLDVDGIKAMSMGFVLGDSPAVMRGPMVSNYINQVFTQTDWGVLDYLLLDMPPGTGDTQLTITQAASLQGAIIVTTPQALSLVDVARGILMFERVNVPVLGLVENMSYFDCKNCTHRHFIFGSGANALKERFGIETLAQFPIVQGISDLASAEAGADLEPLRQLTENLKRALCRAQAQQAPLPEITATPEALEIRWPDGAVSNLPNTLVRGACKCAQCVDEHTGKRLVTREDVDPDVYAVEITPLGNYAVSITWSDKHASGIFAWDYLKALATA